MDSPRWLDDEEQRAWRAFLFGGRLLMNRLDRELLVSAGMPVAYFEVLVGLSESPGRAMRMSELARRSQSSPSRLSHAVARLEELGWVRREACPTDRRGAVAVLTDKGFRVLDAAAAKHVESIRAHLFDRLGREQVTQLREIFETVSRPLSDDAARPCDEAISTCDEATSPGAEATPYEEQACSG